MIQKEKKKRERLSANVGLYFINFGIRIRIMLHAVR
jgi:hypothetical protein